MNGQRGNNERPQEGSSSRQASSDRITELEVELKVAQETIANLRDYNKRAPKLAVEAENTRIAELEARLAAQAEDHTPLSAIETLFMAGVNQCMRDEEGGREHGCPYPRESISRHWWTRGYAHQARAFRAVELEAQLKEVQGNWKKYEPIVGRMEKAEADAARLRAKCERLDIALCMYPEFLPSETWQACDPDELHESDVCMVCQQTRQKGHTQDCVWAEDSSQEPSMIVALRAEQQAGAESEGKE